jgi:hypothetical protein
MPRYGCPQCRRELRRGTDGRPKRCNMCGDAPFANVYGCVPCDVDICDACMEQATGDRFRGAAGTSTRSTTCSTCNGAGRVRMGAGFMLGIRPCPACGGRGTSSSPQRSSGASPADDLFSLLTGHMRRPSPGASAGVAQSRRRSAGSVHTPRSRDEFHELVRSSKAVVVDVTADWCPPSRAMAPIVKVCV